MFIQYNNLDINFTIGSTRFRTLNIAYEHLHRIIPSHSHGDNSYEIHYVASGRGYITVGEKTYEITPNTPVSYTHLDVYKRQHGLPGCFTAGH